MTVGRVQLALWAARTALVLCVLALALLLLRRPGDDGPGGRDGPEIEPEAPQDPPGPAVRPDRHAEPEVREAIARKAPAE